MSDETETKSEEAVKSFKAIGSLEEVSIEVFAKAGMVKLIFGRTIHTHSGVSFAPQVARDLAAALLESAGECDGVTRSIREY